MSVDLDDEFVDTIKTEMSVINKIPSTGDLPALKIQQQQLSEEEDAVLISQQFQGFDVEELIVKLGALQEVPFCADILNIVTDVPEFTDIAAMSEYLEHILPVVSQAMMSYFPNEKDDDIKNSTDVLRSASFSFTKNLPFYPSGLNDGIEFNSSRSPSPMVRPHIFKTRSPFLNARRSQSIARENFSSDIDSSQLNSAFVAYALVTIERQTLVLVEDFILRLLPKVQKNLEHWKSMRSSPWSYLMQKGPYFILHNLFSSSNSKVMAETPSPAHSATSKNQSMEYGFKDGSSYKKKFKDSQKTISSSGGILMRMRYINIFAQLQLEDKVDFLISLRTSLISLLGYVHHELANLSSIKFYGDGNNNGRGSLWTSYKIKKRLVELHDMFEKFSENILSNQLRLPSKWESFENLANDGVCQGTFEDAHLLSSCCEYVIKLCKTTSQMELIIDKEAKLYERPGHFRRYWLYYGVTIVGAGSVIYNMFYGKPGFWAWIFRTAKESLISFYHEHFSVPLNNIVQRLFLKRNLVAIEKAKSDLKDSKISLSRMLYNFGLSDMETNSELSWLLEPQNANEKKKYENILNSRANQLDMSIVMKRYENEISQPIVNLARGELMRSVLIQLQKLKVDTESTIVELDTLIEENDLNLQLLATVPGILLLSPIIFFVHRQIFMRKTAGTETHHKMRKCVGRLQDRLICAYPADASGIFETIEDTGFLLWQCDQIGTYSSSLRRRHMISREDLKQIDRDVRILKSLNLDVAQKRLLINKMYLTHRFLRVN